MTTASDSTKLKASDKLDTRPAIFGRKVTSTFRKFFSFNHKPPGNIRTCWIPPLVFLTPIINLPKLLKLRFYLKRELPYAPEPENFAKAIEGFKAMKFRGANVTIPYKTEFFNADGSARLVDELSEISKFTGSVNTLYWKGGIVGGTLCGTTTDPYGCVRNLEENGVNPTGKRIALLGNGGAAQSIAFKHTPDFGALLLDCQGSEPHLQTVEKACQGCRA